MSESIFEWANKKFTSLYLVSSPNYDAWKRSASLNFYQTCKIVSTFGEYIKSAKSEISDDAEIWENHSIKFVGLHLLERNRVEAIHRFRCTSTKMTALISMRVLPTTHRMRTIFNANENFYCTLLSIQMRFSLSLPLNRSNADHLFTTNLKQCKYTHREVFVHCCSIRTAFIPNSQRSNFMPLQFIGILKQTFRPHSSYIEIKPPIYSIK